jgi:poly(hydroxyalkanoate) depolymerase family esterase
MNSALLAQMAEATRLTRLGDLQAATAAIQAALGGTAPAAATPGEVIDVEARVVHSPAQSPPVDSEPSAGTDERPGTFVAGSFANAIGRRDYKLFVPPQAGERALPLVVMLHGCTQDPDDFAAGTRMNEAAREQGFFVLYPAQSRRMNPQGCWNWFKHSHQKRGSGEPAILADMTKDVIRRHDVDARRVFIAGLSAGGAMAAIMGEAYPEIYSAVGVHSGLAAGAATDLPGALMAMKSGSARVPARAAARPTIVFHGDADATVNAVNSERVVTAAAGDAQAVQVERIHRGTHRASTRHVHRAADGRVVAEHWIVHGGAHAWFGGSAAGSYTDGQGPDATAEMLRFFFDQPHKPCH